MIGLIVLAYAVGVLLGSLALIEWLVLRLGRIGRAATAARSLVVKLRRIVR